MTEAGPDRGVEDIVTDEGTKGQLLCWKGFAPCHE